MIDNLYSSIYTLTSQIHGFADQAVSFTPRIRVNRGYCYAIECSKEYCSGTAYDMIVPSVYTVKSLTLQIHGLHGLKGCVMNYK